MVRKSPMNEFDLSSYPHHSLGNIYDFILECGAKEKSTSTPTSTDLSLISVKTEPLEQSTPSLPRRQTISK